MFAKRPCGVFDDEINRIAKEVGGCAKAFKLVKKDKKLVRFYIPLEPANLDDSVWSVIRKLADKIGLTLTDYMREIAKENPSLSGIIDRVDFNATTHGQRDISDDRLSALIEQISLKRLGLNDVEADIIGRSYEYLIRKFAEGGGQSAGAMSSWWLSLSKPCRDIESLPLAAHLHHHCVRCSAGEAARGLRAGGMGASGRQAQNLSESLLVRSFGE